MLATLNHVMFYVFMLCLVLASSTFITTQILIQYCTFSNHYCSNRSSLHLIVLPVVLIDKQTYYFRKGLFYSHSTYDPLYTFINRALRPPRNSFSFLPENITRTLADTMRTLEGLWDNTHIDCGFFHTNYGISPQY